MLAKARELLHWSAWREIVRTTAERQAWRGFLWLPVAFGLGAAAYLCLPTEPKIWWVAAPFFVLVGGWYLTRKVNLPVYVSYFALLCLMFTGGALICKLRTEHVKAPILSSARTEYRLEAVVIDNVSPSKEEPRLLLAPTVISGLAPADVPLRLRVSLRPGMIQAFNIQPGDTISAFAILNPPPPPLIPGGYDYGRTAYFQGIGGVGFIPGEPRVVPAQGLNWRLNLITGLNRLRWSLTQRVIADIAPAFHDGSGLGGFAAALVTGHQAHVSQSLIANMRDSGLAHILSISGVHMAVVGGFIFFALRLGMATIPWLVLRIPVKKVAAGLGIAGVAAYLAISGAPAPAIRAAVVAWVAFIAILLDRKALSLRALAVAAFIVICLTPEAVIQPGFQMSFCATAALLALTEVWKAPIAEISVPAWVKAIQSSIQAVWLSLLVSLVATLATTPFSIAYFNRFSVYGLLSNLFEAPVTTFVVMPGLAVGALFSGTPLGTLAMRFAACGLWLIEKIASVVASFRGAVITWPSAPDYVLLISFLGLTWVCLMRGKARWLGLALGSSILLWPRQPAPDIWIDPNGANAAIRTDEAAYALRNKVKQYGFEQWARHNGLKTGSEGARNRNYECVSYACIPLPDARLRVGFWFSNRAPNSLTLTTLCLNSDLVVLRSPIGDWPNDCAGVNRITAGDFQRLGAVELTRNRGEWHVKAAQPLRGNRPWTRPSGADADQ